MVTPHKYPKADVSRRFIAVFIDFIIAYIVSLLPVIGGLIGTVYILFRDGFDWDFMCHRSIGKRVMNLDVVMLADPEAATTLKDSFRRNWILALPAAVSIIPILGWILFIPLTFIVFLVEGLRVLSEPDGKRFGDDFAGTQVVEDSALVEPIERRPPVTY